jgi:hypothetical protein
MKNLFNDISQDERNRILEMHQSATKKNYLSEQDNPVINNTSVPNKVAKIKSSPEDLIRFTQFDQNYIQSLFPKLVINTKEEWDSIKYPLQQVLTWYAKTGKNPSTDVLSSIVSSVGGDFPQRYQIMIKGDKSATARGFVADATTLNKQIVLLYNNQLSKI